MPFPAFILSKLEQLFTILLFPHYFQLVKAHNRFVSTIRRYFRMKKIGLICATILAGLSLSACNNMASQKSHSSSSSSSKPVKIVKQHKTHKQTAKKNKAKKQSQSTSSSSQVQNNSTINQRNNGNNQQTTTKQSNNGGQQQAQGKSQGEINRERGYDPNGAPLLPGQDHAAGSNPDGTPDAWVQGQIDWAKQNGYLNPDGTETQKGIQADQEVERDSQPGMP